MWRPTGSSTPPTPTRPTCAAPRALVAFGGWVDAGLGRHGRGASPDLQPEHTQAGRDRSRRLLLLHRYPPAGVGRSGAVSARCTGRAASSTPRTLEHTSDLLLFVAPEPNLKWRTFAALMLDVMQRFEVSSMVCIGSIFGAVPHRAEVRMTGWANNAEQREALQRLNVLFTNYEGPTGFVTVLLAEAQSRGMPASAVYAFAPNYIQGVPNPRVSHALLRAFASLTGYAAPAGRAGSRRARAHAPGRPPAAGSATTARAGRTHAEPDEHHRAAASATTSPRKRSREEQAHRTSSCPVRKPW